MIIHEPLFPSLPGIVSYRLDRSSAKWDRVSWIRHKLRVTSTGRGRGKSKCLIRLQIKTAACDAAAALAGYRPSIELAPLVRTGLERRDRSKVRLRRAVLEILR